MRSCSPSSPPKSQLAAPQPADRPPTSDEFVAAQGRYYNHMIECFGADRCMFESNFPVDRMSLSYRVLWNGLKKLARDCSDSERAALMGETLARVYNWSPSKA